MNSNPYNLFIKNSLIKIYTKKANIVRVSENLSYVLSTTNIQGSFHNTEIFNNLSEKLKTHLSILEKRISEDNNILNSTMVNTSLLTKTSLISPVNSVRIMNEIVEDDLNNLMRSLLNKELELDDSTSTGNSNSNYNSTKNELNQENHPINRFKFNSEFKKELIYLRDDYKSIIPAEVVTFNEKRNENEYDSSNILEVFYRQSKGKVEEISNRVNNELISFLL